MTDFDVISLLWAANQQKMQSPLFTSSVKRAQGKQLT